MAKLGLAVVFALGFFAQVSARADSADFFDRIKEGDYGTLRNLCGMHIEKNTAARRLIVESIDNPVGRNIACNDRGTVVSFDCLADSCAAYIDQKRTKFTINSEDVLDDGNFVRLQFDYNFSTKTYDQTYSAKFRKI